MFETRKFMDYELAYIMYKKCKQLLASGGIDELDNYFEEVGDRVNGYTTYYGADYNTYVYIVNDNAGTDKENDTWLGNADGLRVSGEVDIISYSNGEDTIYINDESMIEDRIGRLLDYAKDNNYSIEDYERELLTLEVVLAQVKMENKNYGVEDLF